MTRRKSQTLSTGTASGTVFDMRRADLREFHRLQKLILTEREHILERLREIEQSLDALGMNGTERFYGFYTPTGRSRNRQSLREVVIEVLQNAKKPMSKHEVLNAVIATGYRFSTNNPLNSLCVILYTKNSVVDRTSKDRFILRRRSQTDGRTA